MAIYRTTGRESFRLDSLAANMQAIRSLARPNSDYSLSVSDLTDMGYGNERIYEYVYPADQISLEDKRTGEAGLNEILVKADGSNIGRIRDADLSHIRNLIANCELTGLELKITGGAWKQCPDEQDAAGGPKTGTAVYSAILTIYYRMAIAASRDLSAQDAQSYTGRSVMQPSAAQIISDGAAGPSGMAGISPGMAAGGSSASSAQAPAAGLQTGAAGASAAAPASGQSSEGASGEANQSSAESGWIDTTYETVEREKDPVNSGIVFLIIAAILSMLYLGFSIPSWIPSLKGTAPAITIGSFTLSGIDTLQNAIPMIIALLLNLAALFFAHFAMPLTAAAAYIACGILVPQYVLYASVPALLCILGGLFKRHGSLGAKIFLSIVLAGIAGFFLWQYFTGRNIFNPFAKETGYEAGIDSDEESFFEEDTFDADEDGDVFEVYDGDFDDGSWMEEDFDEGSWYEDNDMVFIGDDADFLDEDYEDDEEFFPGAGQPGGLGFENFGNPLF